MRLPETPLHTLVSPPRRGVRHPGQLAMACSARCVGSSRRRAKPWARFLRSFWGPAGLLALTHDGDLRSFSPVSGGFCWPSNSAIRASWASIVLMS